MAASEAEALRNAGSPCSSSRRSLSADADLARFDVVWHHEDQAQRDHPFRGAIAADEPSIPTTTDLRGCVAFT
ncbi:hypothetical protein [Mycobacterium heckeshornense]|nr:hypothetical protein [Mycobacterium heckeshornense]